MFTKAGETHASLFFRIIRWSGIVSAGVQLIIEPSVDNLYIVLLVLVSSLILFEYLYRSESLIYFPLSSIAMLGLCLMSQFVSLVVQTVYWHPLGYMLRAPDDTFAVLAAVQVLAVGAHWTYRKIGFFQVTKNFLAERVLAPLGGFAVPSVGSIWTMAFFGALSMFAGGAQTGNVGGKIFQALSFLSWVPFMIPIYYKKYGERYCSIRTQGVVIALYVMLLVVIGMARNARQIMLIGPLQAAFMFLIMALQDPKPVAKSTYRNLVIFGIVGAVGVQLVGDLATAMVIVRDKRTTLSYFDMVGETISALTDRTRIELYRDNALADAKTSPYDEVYISNPVMARFSETKFHDNMIYLSGRLSDAGRVDVKNLLKDKIISIIPENLLRRFGVRMDKDRYVYSGGDIYRYVNGEAYSLGSFSTGSMWADLINLYGYLSPLVAVGILLTCFVALDSFSRRQPGVINISAIALCSLWSIYSHGLGAESLAAKIQFLVRDLPQSAVLYLMFYWSLRLFSKRSSRVEGVDVPLTPISAH